jgi:hypothetical protein
LQARNGAGDQLTARAFMQFHPRTIEISSRHEKGEIRALDVSSFNT